MGSNERSGALGIWARGYRRGGPGNAAPNLRVPHERRALGHIIVPIKSNVPLRADLSTMLCTILPASTTDLAQTFFDPWQIAAHQGRSWLDETPELCKSSYHDDRDWGIAFGSFATRKAINILYPHRTSSDTTPYHLSSTDLASFSDRSPVMVP